MESLKQKYERDRSVWNACASVYEERIVAGHPDVTAYESFEEDFLDRLLAYLIRDCQKKVMLFDIGCGSGRLHLRYGAKATPANRLPLENGALLEELRRMQPAYGFDPVLAQGLTKVSGIDFSREMIELGQDKLRRAGLDGTAGPTMTFELGSAFDLDPFTGDALPVVVAVCNTIGVMQGESGAQELFKSMNRALHEIGGIAIISGYRKEAVESFALGNYESTMTVCGQPRWLTPSTYASPEYVQIPKYYKRAYDRNPEIEVDVLDKDGALIDSGHKLTRDPAMVRQVIASGHIQTYSDYESRWYSYEQIQDWIDAHWPGDKTFHFLGGEIDALRAAPAQLAILDRTGLMTELVLRLSS